MRDNPLAVNNFCGMQGSPQASHYKYTYTDTTRQHSFSLRVEAI